MSEIPKNVWKYLKKINFHVDYFSRVFFKQISKHFIWKQGIFHILLPRNINPREIFPKNCLLGRRQTLNKISLLFNSLCINDEFILIYHRITMILHCFSFSKIKVWQENNTCWTNAKVSPQEIIQSTKINSCKS